MTGDATPLPAPDERAGPEYVTDWANSLPERPRCQAAAYDEPACELLADWVVTWDYRAMGGNYRDHFVGCVDHLLFLANRGEQRRSPVYLECRWDDGVGCWVLDSRTLSW